MCVNACVLTCAHSSFLWSKFAAAAAAALLAGIELVSAWAPNCLSACALEERPLYYWIQHRQPHPRRWVRRVGRPEIPALIQGRRGLAPLHARGRLAPGRSRRSGGSWRGTTATASVTWSCLARGRRSLRSWWGSTARTTGAIWPGSFRVAVFQGLTRLGRFWSLAIAEDYWREKRGDQPPIFHH